MARVSAKRTVWTSFLVDGIDIGLNVTMMIITGSVVLLAEALEGGSDMLASGLLLIGLGISKRRPDKNHPFGFGKALFSWTLLSAMVMLIFGAGLSFYFGLKRFREPHDLEHIGLAYLALGISICTNGYALSLSTRRLLHTSPIKNLREIFFNSAHVETKNTFVLDLTGTSAALIGFVAILTYQLSGIKQLDGIGGMLMGLVMGLFSIILIWGVKDFLAGKGAPPELRKKIKDVVLTFPGVISIREFNTMYIGSEKLLLQLDLTVKKTSTIKQTDDLVNELKDAIKKEVPIVTSIQIETIPS